MEILNLSTLVNQREHVSASPTWSLVWAGLV